MEEFIVDCTNNSTEKRAEVYKWLYENRDHDGWYLSKRNQYPIIVCNLIKGDANYNLLSTAKNKHPNHPVYTFEEFKTKYLEKKRRNVKRKRNERIHVRCFGKNIF